MTPAIPFTLDPANEATTAPERRGLERDAVRLLVTDIARRTQRDTAFGELATSLRRGDLLVVNDSATLAAALVAHRADGTPLPLHLSTHVGGELWIAEPRATVRAGERVALGGGGGATFLAPVDRAQSRLWYTLLEIAEPLDAFLAQHGAPIRYRYVTEMLPLASYQTMFARVPGSAEMPSAGRPFTERSIDALRRAGVTLAAVTLHTGVSSAERHERPYREWFAVPAAAAGAVNDTRRRGGRVVAVGTTVVRALESAVSAGAAIAARGWTDLIVTPERGVAVVDGLLTGFHEPEASHLDVLRAFADDALLERAYAHALDAGYLWHEFGDVHLLL